jgi:hypothetical protein
MFGELTLHFCEAIAFFNITHGITLAKVPWLVDFPKPAGCDNLRAQIP